MDSGGFTELSLRGYWSVSAKQYTEEAYAWSEAIGGLDWAAPQDWMCEPVMLAKTGKTVLEHQERTVASVLELRALEPRIQWIPVIQGWDVADYIRCVDMYDKAGLPLHLESTVGVGSVCRRQGTQEIANLLETLSRDGLKLHGFGVKAKGLEKAAPYLKSADSMAWSFRARRSDPLPGCPHASCANCMKYALKWRTELLARLQ